MICPSCQKDISDNASYCVFCGAHFNSNKNNIQQPEKIGHENNNKNKIIVAIISFINLFILAPIILEKAFIDGFFKLPFAEIESYLILIFIVGFYSFFSIVFFIVSAIRLVLSLTKSNNKSSSFFRILLLIAFIAVLILLIISIVKLMTL